MSKYQEYTEVEEAAGREPLAFNEWKKERLAAGREKAAANRVADAEPDFPQEYPESAPDFSKPAEPIPPEEITHLNFCAPENRFMVQIVQPGGRTVIDGSIAVRPHVTIEFQEYHWVADLSDPDQKMKAEWLLQCRDYQRGKIVLVPAVRPPKMVAIQTGPRTSMSASQRGNEQVAPVQPPPNIAAALSASLAN